MSIKRIVVLTGAGISAESGIQTFRAADGLWENHRVEDVATPEGFSANPELVQSFYNQRRRGLLDESVQPNAAHIALAELEQNFPGEFLLVTQNIDDLHERSGSRRLIHMHGELLKMRCISSQQVHEIRGDITPDLRCGCCGLREMLRPHVVWFGEMPLGMDDIYTALAECNLFIAVGTSGQVYPAAGFVQVANEAGARTVEVNLDESAQTSAFAEQRRGLASRELPNLCREILATAR